MEFIATISPFGKRALAYLLLFALIFLSGCGSKPKTLPLFDDTQHVILGPGDVLNIQFSYSPELNTIQTVRHDGKVALQLIGEVNVNGKTPQEVQKLLVGLYSTQLKITEITVTVDAFYSNRIYVGGAVAAPGLLDLPGRLTAFEAIIESGGFDPVSANITAVKVLRFENGKRRGYEINFEPVVEGLESPVFYLRPFDVVYVPEKRSVRIGRWIDLHIDGMIPGILASSTMLAYLLSR